MLQWTRHGTSVLGLIVGWVVAWVPIAADAKLGITGGCDCSQSQNAGVGESYCTASQVTYTSKDGTSFSLSLGDPDGIGPEDATYECGQYANGDVWIVGKSDGLGGTVVRVDGTSPSWEPTAEGCSTCATGRHGWMTDPTALNENHLDGRQVDFVGFVPPTTAEPLPQNYSVTTGYRSFLKQVGLDTVDTTGPNFNVCRIGNHSGCAKFNGIVTFVECKSGCTYPADSDADGSTGDEFRPSYMGSGAQKVAGLRMDQIAVKAAASLGQLDASLLDPALLTDWTFGDVRDNWRHPRFDHTTGFTQWMHMGVENFTDKPMNCSSCSRQEYGHEMGVVNAAGIQRLQLDDWSLGGVGDDSYLALAGIVQNAIDLFAINQVTGKRWRYPENNAKFLNSGGHHAGRKLLGIFLAHLFADDPTWALPMSAFATGDTFFEDVLVNLSDDVPYFGIREEDCDADGRVIPGSNPFRHQCANSIGPGQWLRYDSLCRGGSSWAYPWVDSTVATYNYITVRTMGLETLWNDAPYLEYAYTFREGGRGGDPNHTGGAYCAPDGSLYGYDWGEGNPGWHKARRHSFGEAMWSAFSPACNDGFDNDGDGNVDLADAECTGTADLSERLNACGDGIDNDSDGLFDYPDDPGCRHSRWTTEDPSCNDGVDNDQDTFTDLSDPDCSAAWGRLERPLATDDIVVADASLRGVVRVDPGTGLQERFAELGEIDEPIGLTFDVDGGVLVADRIGAKIIRISPDGEQRIEANALGASVLPDVAVESSGNRIVAYGLGSTTTSRVDRATGLEQIVANLPVQSTALALEAGGDFLVPDAPANKITRIDALTGNASDAATGGSILTPVAVAVGPAGEIIVANDSPAELVSIDPVTSVQTVISSGGLLSAIGRVAITVGGDAIVTDTTNLSVVRVPIAGGAQVLVSQQGLIAQPLGIDVLLPACDDGLDNDFDGLVDYPLDTGCTKCE